MTLAACCLLLISGFEPEDLAARRERVVQMAAAEKVQLHRLWERFQSLSPAEQEKLRQFEREIAEDEHAAELRDIMRRYYQWCKTLPAYQRLELLELPAKERVAHIRKIKRQTEDADGLRAWLDAQADRVIS
ncbi:unnamed protein product, partial [marine sediment metagenome]